MKKEGYSEVNLVKNDNEVSVAQDIYSNEVLINGNHGLGFGLGNISLEQRIKSGEVTENEIAESQSKIPQHIVEVVKHDCGCGDGRSRDDLGQIVPRAKVFGGSPTMTVAGLTAIGEIPSDPTERFSSAINHLKRSGIKYGGHTADNKGINKDSGCGAIDRFPEIMGNIQYYQTDIKSSLMLILGESFDEEIYTKVMANYKKAFEGIDYSNFQGSEVSRKITESGATSTKLKGGHKEAFLVINKRNGTTLDQTGFNMLTQDEIQAFCIDDWRMQDLALTFSTDGDETRSTMAYYGMWIDSLGTSSVLTDGSQRIVVTQ